MLEQAHLQQLAQALEEERAWQEREHRSALRLPLEDRVAMGLCWSPVTVMDVEPAGRGTLITLRAPHRGGLHDGIRPGDRVEVAGHDGLCWSADDTTAEIRLDGEVELTGQVAVTRRFDPTTFRRAARALETADAHR